MLSQDSLVGIATWAIGWMAEELRFYPDRSKIFFPSPQRPDWLLDPSSLLYNGYQGFFPGGKVTGA
jgi:hypothetical protein